MTDFVETLRRRLDGIREQGLWRELHRLDAPTGRWIETGGRRLLNFASNDYLGLAAHPVLREAAAQAARQFGAGSGASRSICGSLAPHHELETALADFKGAEAALAFSSGYAAALGTIPALVGAGDVVVLDKLVHACIVDAARLSGAKLRVFAHNDLADLEVILRWAEARPRPAGEPAGNVLVVTESVFSMDGDQAPLTELVKLKDRFGAWLMVDEAHATGLYGRQGRGLAEALGVAGRIEIQMGTLGKALGAAGGFIAGSRELWELLINRARSFVFSTAPVPAASAAATAALDLVRSAAGDELRAQLWSRVRQLRDGLANLGWPVPAEPSAILPLIVGDEAAAVELASRLREAGFFVPAIRFPTVARGAARLRVTVSASHSPADVEGLLRALAAGRPAAKNATPGVRQPHS